MTLILAPIIFIAAVLYVAYPFLRESQEASRDEAELSERERVLEEKEEIISNIKDIEMDYRMGKLSDEDYARLKTDFEERAVEVFQRLESLPKNQKRVSES
ncbi:MAG: hypothetical protein ACRD1R_11415 [Acidobacteriota bacterium]